MSSGCPAHPAGMKLPKPWEFDDMIGNALQWTGDWFGETHYGSSPSIVLTGPPEENYRVNRGEIGDVMGAR